MILSIVLAGIGLLIAAYFVGKKVQRNQLADVIWTRNY